MANLVSGVCVVFGGHNFSIFPGRGYRTSLSAGERGLVSGPLVLANQLFAVVAAYMLPRCQSVFSFFRQEKRGVDRHAGKWHLSLAILCGACFCRFFDWLGKRLADECFCVQKYGAS